MSRVYNFGAGPSTLPESVLEQARAELFDWHHLGMSVMECSHRAKEFMELAAEAEQDLRDLLNIPAHYKVLFLQGGARAQFAMVPLNLFRDKKIADYFDTGIWSAMAMKEAVRYGTVNVVASTAELNYNTIPLPSAWQLREDADYCHYVDNETVNGVEFPYIPTAGKNVVLVADMSSNILSRPFDVCRFGLVYAGAQKNMGPAGLTLVIIREDLLGKALPFTPTIFNYKSHVDSDSLFNTPPTFTWYMISLVLKWLKQSGGVEAMSIMHQRRSAKLYDFIDNNTFYINAIDKAYRSRMNVIFKLADEKLNTAFLQESKRAGLAALKGHSMVGGMRASLYNALPEQAVDALIDFMTEFARKYG